jgi:hypothetical protein
VWTDIAPTVSKGSEAPATHRRWPYVVVLLVLAVGGWWLFGGRQGSGDPGGTIMNQLAPAASALPGYGTANLPWASQPSLTAPYLIRIEPQRDSCDGMAGTQGWSQVVVQGSFRWAGSHEALFAKITSGLSSLGWHRRSILSTNEAMWKKGLENGSVATAMLNLSPLGGPNWEFVALAPPAGGAAKGC